MDNASLNLLRLSFSLIAHVVSLWALKHTMYC